MKRMELYHWGSWILEDFGEKIKMILKKEGDFGIMNSLNMNKL